MLGWAPFLAALFFVSICPSGVQAVGVPHVSHHPTAGSAEGSDDISEKHGFMRSEDQGRSKKGSEAEIMPDVMSLLDDAVQDPEIAKVMHHVATLAAGMEQDVLPSDVAAEGEEAAPQNSSQNSSWKTPPGALDEQLAFSDEDSEEGDGIFSQETECKPNRRRSRRRQGCPPGFLTVEDVILLEDSTQSDPEEGAQSSLEEYQDDDAESPLEDIEDVAAPLEEESQLDAEDTEPQQDGSELSAALLEDSEASETSSLAPVYQGCFKDDWNRDLPHYAGSNMKHARCQAACEGYAYFGVQANYQCYCGNSYGKHGSRKDCACHGSYVGSWRNCVYRVPHALPTFLGCYGDQEKRDLPHFKGYFARIDQCAVACSDYAFFGRQGRLQCFCGNSYGKYGKKSCSPQSRSLIGMWAQAVYMVPRFSLKYEGCYVDSANRDLQHYMGGSKSLGTCQAKCKKYKFFGRQSWGQCFCGNNFGEYSKIDDCTCSSNHIGGWRNCIYSQAPASQVDAIYKGCYRDKGSRDLPHFAGWLSYTQCKAACQGFEYFGRQASSECWCGNSYGKHGARGDCSCSASKIGGWRNCVYHIYKECTSRRRTRRRARRRITCQCPPARRRTRRRARRRTRRRARRRRRASLIAYLHQNAATATAASAADTRTLDQTDGDEEAVSPDSVDDDDIDDETSDSAEQPVKPGKKGASLAVLLGHVSNKDRERASLDVRRRASCVNFRRRTRRRTRRRSRRRTAWSRRMAVGDIISLKTYQNRVCRILNSKVVCDQDATQYEKFTSEMQFKVVDCGQSRVCFYNELAKQYCGWDSRSALSCTFNAVSASTKFREEQEGTAWSKVGTGYFAIKPVHHANYCALDSKSAIRCDVNGFSTSALFKAVSIPATR